ncbi:NADAR family protein [Deinococcus sp. 6GRE01]|uniref:NADAR family protein n=1 Tax=Deinococcus sp. 6GRE01 TaxID=2745873 RepID=UPI001E420A7F|nr:NADAR family protein [Deinococcus sp. 6GRE01]MCD0156666.1 NADAR family protein [Deinococcus sp. 6GRE01]
MSPDPVFFYRTAHPFSNFHPSAFTEDGVAYHCAEQYLMARKAALFGDEATRRAILAARTPGECKALGRRVSPYDDARWAAERFGVALDMLRLKFGQNARLRAALLATGEAEVVEAAPNDRIWGVGFSEQDAPGARQAWGENLLGRALMSVRTELGGAALHDGPLKFR